MSFFKRLRRRTINFFMKIRNFKVLVRDWNRNWNGTSFIVPSHLLSEFDSNETKKKSDQNKTSKLWNHVESCSIPD